MPRGACRSLKGARKAFKNKKDKEQKKTADVLRCAALLGEVAEMENEVMQMRTKYFGDISLGTPAQVCLHPQHFHRLLMFL